MSPLGERDTRRVAGMRGAAHATRVDGGRASSDRTTHWGGGRGARGGLRGAMVSLTSQDHNDKSTPVAAAHEAGNLTATLITIVQHDSTTGCRIVSGKIGVTAILHPPSRILANSIRLV